MNKRVKMLLIDVVIVAALLAFDQYTKMLAILHLKNNPAIVLIDGVLYPVCGDHIPYGDPVLPV